MNIRTAKTTPYNSLKQGIWKSPTNDSALEKLKDKDKKGEEIGEEIVERHVGNDFFPDELFGFLCKNIWISIMSEFTNCVGISMFAN